MDIPWTNIGDVTKAAVPLIGAITSIATLIVVGTISHRQWRTAKDKLALDLFDRRIKAWNDVQTCLSTAIEAAEKGFIENGEVEIPNSTLFDLARIESDAHWLFGEEVRLKISEVSVRLIAMIGHDLDDDFDSPHRTRAAQFQNILSRPALIALSELRRMVEPYMMMGHIAVNRPSKSFRSPW